MDRTLARTVVAIHPETRETYACVAGTVPPDWAVEQITNPLAWELPTPTARLRRLGATDDEVAALQRAFATLPADQQDDAFADVDDQSDDEIREQLTEFRALLAESGMTVEQALAEAVEQDATEVGRSDVGTSEPESGDGGKPLDKMTKEELIAEAERRDPPVDASGTKADLLERLQES